MMSWWKNETTSTYSLGIDDLNKAIKRLQSGEYFNECFERDWIRISSQMLVNKAWVAGKISDDRAFRYFESISINGILLLHPKDENLAMFQKLAEEPLTTPKEKESR